MSKQFNYANHVPTRKNEDMDYDEEFLPGRASFNPSVSQTEVIPGREDDMTLNAAGGYTFAIDPWQRLDRFLILGSEGGTYYVGANKLTKENAFNAMGCVAADGVRVVNRVLEISREGRAPNNDPALFVLAMCVGAKNPETRQAAFKALPHVARIPTHLFHFVEYTQAFRGWGRAMKRAVGNWYNSKDLDKLVMQVTKYKSRDKWSNRDLLRLSHVKASSPERNLLYKWIVDNEKGVQALESFPALKASVQLAHETDPSKAVELITQYRLPREVLSTELLRDAKVWEALLQDMPMTAMIRNLGKMSSIGLLSPMSDNSKLVAERLTDVRRLKAARVHPVSLLSALSVYAGGHGQKGSLEWKVNPAIKEALEEAFYLSFGFLQPTGKRYLLALDLSSSMTWTAIRGAAGLYASQVAAAMSMVTARTEDLYHIMGFSSEFKTLGISRKHSLEEVLKIVYNNSFGATDCSQPMLWAQKNNVNVDAFVVYTDNETYAGTPHPSQALRNYRQATGIDAKMIVCATSGTRDTIADPRDPGMLDISGFDSSTPAIIGDFVRGLL